MLRLAFDFIITWRETRTRPNAYETIEIVCLRCTSHVVRDAHLVVLDMCISCSMERDNSFHKV